MFHLEPAQPSQLFIGRLDQGKDLLRELYRVARKKSIRLGRVEAMGAVQKARLSYYDQGNKNLQYLSLDEPLDIIQLTGNICVLDGEPSVKATATFADKKGHVYGGQLAAGTEIFACEFIIESFQGPEFMRTYDDQTGLELWTT